MCESFLNIYDAGTFDDVIGIISHVFGDGVDIEQGLVNGICKALARHSVKEIRCALRGEKFSAPEDLFAKLPNKQADSVSKYIDTLIDPGQPALFNVV